MAGHHDIGYKHLFAHPELVRELVSEFTALTWIGALDISAFERVNPSYVSERFSERQDDLVWRVRCGDDWLYIYILLEFQSRVEPWMALRMQVYIGLLYQDLIKRHEVSPASLLPPVLPLVFYNGDAPWSAGLNLADLIMSAPPGLAKFQAHQRYCLVDQQRLDRAGLADKSGLLAMIFRLELSDSPAVLLEILPTLECWWTAHEQTPLRQAVLLWVERLVKREYFEVVGIDSFQMREVTGMGARKFATWTDEAKYRGRQEGLAEGLAEGSRIGLINGLKTVIELRFGAVPESLVEKIRQIEPGDVERWIARALQADSLAALFADEAPR